MGTPTRHSRAYSRKGLEKMFEAVPFDDVAGTHHFNESTAKITWKFAKTPPKGSSVSTLKLKHWKYFSVGQYTDLCNEENLVEKGHYARSY